jgi:hypothetical protein
VSPAVGRPAHLNIRSYRFAAVPPPSAGNNNGDCCGTSDLIRSAEESEIAEESHGQFLYFTSVLYRIMMECLQFSHDQTRTEWKVVPSYLHREQKHTFPTIRPLNRMYYALCPGCAHSPKKRVTNSQRGNEIFHQFSICVRVGREIVHSAAGTTGRGPEARNSHKG